MQVPQKRRLCAPYFKVSRPRMKCQHFQAFLCTYSVSYKFMSCIHHIGEVVLYRRTICMESFIVSDLLNLKAG